ncbi:hypothetical protein [Actinomycetospora succinea]|uniref:hypothetical protein n=1 Tax=Actinomycetospora succinea TaxID=663603 RepID=UPI00105F6C35|nr:hypothetical protein [Actinomycetospora succinea]
MDEQDGPAVRPEELREAGAACVAAGLEVPVAAPAEAVRDVAVAPTGRSGAAAVALADRWEVAHARWCADLVAHGEALAAAAVAYAAGDGAAATGLMTAGS